MKFSRNYNIDFNQRSAHKETAPIFVERWSPRSFRKITIPQEILESIFDAAHWAPSCYNDQPWLFITSSGETDFNRFLSLLNDTNQAWAKNAALIGFIFARKHFAHNGKPNRWGIFDCGAAWMSLTLQTTMHGLHAHGMAGIHYERVYEELGVPEEDYQAICGFAIGLIDRPESLPKEFADREIPSPRHPVEKIWYRGAYQGTSQK